MNFIKSYGIWIVIALAIAISWHFYNQAQKAKAAAKSINVATNDNSGIFPAADLGYIPEGGMGDEIV